MQNKTLEVQVLPIEKIVEKNFISEIEKHEIRKEALIQKKNDSLELKINGQEDKEGFNLVRETRLNFKTMRVLIKKICKSKRDPLNAEADAWSLIEKEYTSIISEGENHLQKEEDEYNAEKDRIDAENKRRHDAQFVERSTELTKYGANLIDGYFVLNDIKFEASSIREVDAEIWEQNIKPKYKEIFDKAEELRIENEQKMARMEQMRTTVFNTRFDQLLNVFFNTDTIFYEGSALTSKDNLIDMSDKDFQTLKSLHNSIVEDEIKKEKQAKELKERTGTRTKQLYSLGFAFNGLDYVHDTVTFFEHNVSDATNQKWNELTEIATRQIEVIKEEAKQKQDESRKKAQAEADRLALGTARKSILADYEETGYSDFILSEMEESKWNNVLNETRNTFNNKKQEELNAKHLKEKEEADLKQQEELAKLGDKAKWDMFISKLQAVDIPTAKSGKYRTNISIAREKIEEIINLNTK
jgi:hypothetical protein